ncbi:MAG: MCE family protein [Rubrivivax sp.]|nr:MCE family protein [Rubrivivax sp.]
MTRRTHPLRVGLFVLTGLALLVAALIAVGGGRFLSPRESAELMFAGNLYGLQPGAPVVYRGVRVGSVSSVIVRDDGTTLTVPVEVEIDPARIAGPGGLSPELAALVRRGLSARLAPQSLLTGLLYVDLDLRPPPSPVPVQRSAAGLVRIPTIPEPPGALAQLQQLDLKRLSADLSAAAIAARELLADPELKRSVAQMAELSASLARVSAALERRLPAVADSVQGTLARAGEASQSLAVAARQLGTAAEQVGAAASGAQALFAGESPLGATVRRAAEQLSQSSASLRALVADDGTLVRGVDSTLAEVKRASRAVRELADLLERQPDALLRGRAVEGSK